MTSFLQPAIILSAILAVLLSAIAVYDYKHFRIPDMANAILAGFGILALFTFSHISLADAVLGACTGLVLIIVLRMAFFRYRGYHGIGLGDAKFVGAAGIWTGLSGLSFFLFLASFTALSAVLVLRLVQRKPLEMTERLPFGPFLATALLVFWFARPWLTANHLMAN